MSDIATLGLEMPSDGLKEGIATLRSIPKEAAAAERAIEKLGMTNAAAGQTSEQFSRRVQRNIEVLNHQAEQLGRNAAEQERFTALRRAGVSAESAAGQAVTASVRALQAQRDAQRAAADETRKAQQQQADAARAAQQQADAVRKVTADLEHERAQLSRTSTERLQYDAIRRAGVTAASAEGRAIMANVAALEAEKAALRQLEQVRLAAGRTAGGLSPQQRLMLGYQLNDIFTSAVGGMSPAMIAAQQGPQITQIFGGLRNTLNAIPKPALVAGGSLLAGLGIGLAVNELKELSDAADEQKRRLTSLLGSQQLAADAYGEITKQAIATGTAIADLTTRFSTFAASTQGLGATLPQILQLMEAAGQLGKIGGSTPEETAAGTAAIAKALSMSVVSGDALQAIFDSMPAAAKAIADGIGVSAAQLKLMAQQGDLTGQKMFTSLLGQTDKLKNDFNELPGTIGTVFAGLIIQAEDFAAKLYKAVVNFQIMTDRSKELGVGQGGGGPKYVDIRPNVNYGTPIYEKRFNQADATDLETGLAAAAMASIAINKAITDAADAAVLAGVKIASALDPAAAAAKTLQEQFAAINAGIKAVAASSLDSDTKVAQLDRMSAAAERLKDKIKNAGDAVTQASRELGQTAIDRAIDNTPAGMAIGARTRQLYHSEGNYSSEGAANAQARAELASKAEDAIQAAKLQADAQDKITAATGRGTAAMIDAQVEVAKLSFQYQYFGREATPEAIEAMNRFGAALKRELTAKATASAIDASKQYKDELATIAAAMKVVEQGAYAMKRAEAEARAARATDGTGKLQMQVFDAKQEQSDKMMMVGLQQQIDLTNALAAAAGDVTKQRAIQLDYDIKIAQLAAGPGARAAIEEKMRADAAAKANSVAREGLASMERQVDMAQQQLDIIRTGAPDMAVQLAMLQKRNELIDKGVDLTKEENRQQIELAGKKARIDEQVSLAKDAAEQEKRIWQNAYDNIQSYAGDVFYDIFSGAGFNAQSAAEGMKRIFLRTFAELAAAAIIKPIIQPVFQAGQALGIVPGGVGGTNGFGVPSAANSNGVSIPGGASLGWFGDTFNGIGSWLKSPISGNLPSGQYGPPAPGQSFSTGWMGDITWGQGLGALAGAGMGIYQLATANGNTGKTIGGIGSIIGAGVSLIPGIGQIAGPIISILSSVLPSLFGEADTRTHSSTNANLRYGDNGWYTTGGAYGPGANSGQSEGALRGLTGGIDQVFGLLGGVKDASKVWGLNASSWTAQGKDWSYTSNATHLVDPNGNTEAWRMNMSDMMDTGAAQVAIRSILSGAVGEITDTMKTALEHMRAAAMGIEETAKSITFVDEVYERLGKGALTIRTQFRDLEKQFADMTETTKKLGLSLEPVLAEQKKQTERLGQDYIDNLIDPVAAQLRAWADEKASILENIDYIQKNTDVIVDQARVNEALLRREADLKNDLYNGAVDQLDDAIRRLSYGDLSNMTPGGTLAGMRAAFGATAAQAMSGDMAAIQRIANEGTVLADASRSYFAGSKGFEDDRQSIIDTLQIIQARVTNQDSGSSSNSNDNSFAMSQLAKTIYTMESAFKGSMDEKRELMQQMTELTSIVQRLVANDGRR